MSACPPRITSVSDPDRAIHSFAKRGNNRVAFCERIMSLSSGLKSPYAANRDRAGAIVLAGIIG